MSVVRTGKKPLANGETRFTQGVMQIETGRKPSRISFNSSSRMATDGEVTLESITQNGVNMDTSNPYFQTMLMDKRDLARATYADIVKRRGVKGLEPPLLFEDTSDVFTGKYFDSTGCCHEQNEFIAVNLRHSSKSSIPDTIAHECEHGFVQLANIHRAGLKDMRSENPVSRRFFDGIVERFKPIKQGTVEYEQAQVYASEFNSYDNIVYPEGGFNSQAYHALNCEKDAFKAGELERQVFNQCHEDFVKNFSLFNHGYMLKS